MTDNSPFSWNASWHGEGRDYPWSQWLNGRIWELTQGEDFDVSSQDFQAICHRRAKARGQRVRTRCVGNKVWLQST